MPDTTPSTVASPADAAPRPPRPAATLVLVRDGAAGPEILLLRRAERGDHNSGAWVFPGGLVDAADRATHECCADLDDAALSHRLDLLEGGLDYAVTAIRECFEECGVLLACDADGRAVDATRLPALQAWREPIHLDARQLRAMCREHGLRLAVGSLAYIAHWITPPGRAKRFDTRFFVAAAPAGQASLHDGLELTEHRWIRPADALAQGDALKLMGPTRATLAVLARHADAAALLAWARGLAEVPRYEPHVATGAAGTRPVHPSEACWAEVRRLDPEGRGTARYEVVPGSPVRLSGRVIRLTANNPHFMTGPGTNTYFVGPAVGQAGEWAVIDPGPDDAEHVAAILAAAPGRIRWILATHTHIDHSPAAVALQAATGAEVLGRLPAWPMRQDPSFAPARELLDGERIAVADGTTLRAIHTPGHASNHLCFVLEEERTLFTGDHVMQGSTVVISPPDGDMGAYIASLRALLADEAPRLDWLAPAHGFLIARPDRAIEGLIQHRLRREARVSEVLRASGPATLDELLPRVYDDVAPGLHATARRSLEAHLLKLRDDGLANEQDGRWRGL